MDELIQHFKNLEEDETLKRIDDAYNRGWNDAMNNPEVKKALEKMKPKKVGLQKSGLFSFPSCPNCEEQVGENYCEFCGQALDWHLQK